MFVYIDSVVTVDIVGEGGGEGYFQVIISDNCFIKLFV